MLLQAGVWVCRLWGERGLDGLGQAVQVLAWRQRVWLVRAWRPWDASAAPSVSTEQTPRLVQRALVCLRLQVWLAAVAVPAQQQVSALVWPVLEGGRP